MGQLITDNHHISILEIMIFLFPQSRYKSLILLGIQIYLFQLKINFVIVLIHKKGRCLLLILLIQ